MKFNNFPYFMCFANSVDTTFVKRELQAALIQTCSCLTVVQSLHAAPCSLMEVMSVGWVPGQHYQHVQHKHFLNN